MPTQDTTPAVTQPTSVLPPHQQVVAIVLAIAIVIVVVELVRKRKLREEYSFLWLATAGLLLAMAIETDLLLLFQRIVGAEVPVTALFFGALLFLMLVALQFSVRLSKLTARNKTLCQKIALLERDIEELRGRPQTDESAPPPSDPPTIEHPARTRSTKTEAS